MAVVGGLAYVIDTGSLYEHRRDLQSVADAAALVGVQELPENPSLAVEMAIEYAEKNSTIIESSDVIIGATYKSKDTITVKAIRYETLLFFAGVFGKNTADVGASATAVIGSPSKVSGIVP